MKAGLSKKTVLMTPVNTNMLRNVNVDEICFALSFTFSVVFFIEYLRLLVSCVRLFFSNDL